MTAVAAHLPRRPGALLFDVNETLLDLAPLQGAIDGVLLEPGASTLWFSAMLHHGLVMSAGGQWAPFPDIGVAVLQMLARNRDIVIGDDDAREVLAGMRALPAHADVAPALARLQAAGYRMAALTNSPQAGVAAQLAHAGLRGFFEAQLSVESVRLYKPHTQVYTWAAAQMNLPPGDCMLVAAHGWDVAGAQWAGLQAAFVARPGQQRFPLAGQPALDVADFAALADALGA